MLFKIGRYLMTPGAKMALLAFALVFPFLASNEYQVYVMASAFVWAIAVFPFNKYGFR